jgi:hypothetical protein
MKEKDYKKEITKFLKAHGFKKDGHYFLKKSYGDGLFVQVSNEYFFLPLIEYLKGGVFITRKEHEKIQDDFQNMLAEVKQTERQKKIASVINGG